MRRRHPERLDAHHRGAYRSAPFLLVNASAGDAEGRWARADPADPNPGFACGDPFVIGIGQECAGAFQDALDDIRGEGGYLVEAGATLNLGDASREPRMSLGMTAFYTERKFSVEETGFGVSDSFVERDFRVMISVGIAIPPGSM